MSPRHPRGAEFTIETERLRLRPWRPSEAALLRELWTERDPRVPAHRRIDDVGRPTVEDLADVIRDGRDGPTGLLAMERMAEGDVVGYCGLVDGDDPRTPELAFELLRRSQGRGLATEAARALLDWAESQGLGRVQATVWDWNTPARRVLATLGFTEVRTLETSSSSGRTLVLERQR